MPGGRTLLTLSLLLSAACAGPARPPAGEATARMFQGAVAAGAQGGFETGKLTAAGEALRGPLVVTFLSPGSELQLVRIGAGGEVLGAVAGPLAEPIHLAGNVEARLAGAGDAVYAGYRPMPITRPLEAYVGRQLWIAAPGAPPEQWSLRAIGADHVTLERTRTYRVLPVRRIAEITWTDLTGIDPTPRVVLGPE